MTYTEIVSEITELLGLTHATDLARVGRGVNRKHREVTASLGIKHTSRRAPAQATATIGVSTLQFTSAERVVEVFNRNVTPYAKLDEVTLSELRAQMPFSASDTPTQYAIQTMAGDSVTILLNCVPQTAFVLYADVDSTTATLSGSDEPVFSESYHDILISLVLVDEYMKLEKPNLSKAAYDRVYNPEIGRMGQLRHSIAVSTTKQQYQGKLSGSGGAPSGSGGSGSSVNGALSYTQSGNIHFDRTSAGAGTDPFTVAAGSGKVDNLDADLLDGLNSTAFALAGDAPTAHKTTHENGGSDEISVLGLSGLLADSQTPLAHSAALLTSGTVPDARFPATLPVASGVNLTALNATNLASGSVAVARLANGVTTVLTSTTTSSQNNWAPGLSGNTAIFWSGASVITVTGFAGGVSGQRIIFRNTGTSVATFSHNSGSSSAGNKLKNAATSAGTPVAAGGYAEYTYDGTDWQLTAHQQGAWITPTFAAGDYTASSGNWTVDSGDVTTFAYCLEGRKLSINFVIGSTDVSATPNELNRVIPGSFTITKAQHGVCLATDAGTQAAGMIFVTTSAISFRKMNAAAWSLTAADNSGVTGYLAIEVD